jgi:electron transfer flavoprotein beta subunit
VTALVLVHEGLDVSLPLEPAPGGPAGAARHRGGASVVVTARADRAALEWALAVADTVVALTVGPPASAGVLAWACARGAARAVRVWDEAAGELDLAATARLVAAAVRRIGPDLVLGGERGLAGATGALPALVAAHLGWPIVDGALRLACEPAGIVAHRRLGGGRAEEVLAPCPAVVTLPADAAEPRYVSVRARRAAALRGHDAWTPTDLGFTTDGLRAAVRLRVVGIDWPRPRPRRTGQAVPGGSAAERLRRLVGGPVQSPGGARDPAATAPARLVEGDPHEVADRILAFLAQHGFVPNDS